MLPDLEKLDHNKSVEILGDSDTHALPAVMAACRILGDALLDDEQDIPDEHELNLLLETAGVEVHPDNVTRIIGFLNALTSELFVGSPAHLLRISSAIVEGDPFYFEESGDDVPLWCVLWSLYQVDLMFDENLLDELSDSVKAKLSQMGREEAVDVEAMMAGEGEDSEVKDELMELREILASQLQWLGVPPEWVDQDSDLAAFLLRS